MTDAGHLKKKNFTFAQKWTGMWVFILFLQARAVPSMFLQLELTLVDGNLNALDGGSGDIRVFGAESILFVRQVGKRLTDGVRVYNRLVCWNVELKDVVVETAGNKMK